MVNLTTITKSWQSDAASDLYILHVLTTSHETYSNHGLLLKSDKCQSKLISPFKELYLRSSHTANIKVSWDHQFIATLWTYSADDKLIFFIFFPQKILWHFLQIVSLICMKCQSLFSGKIRKYFKMSSAGFLPSMQSIKQNLPALSFRGLGVFDDSSGTTFSSSPWKHMLWVLIRSASSRHF